MPAEGFHTLTTQSNRTHQH